MVAHTVVEWLAIVVDGILAQISIGCSPTKLFVTPLNVTGHTISIIWNTKTVTWVSLSFEQVFRAKVMRRLGSNS